MSALISKVLVLFAHPAQSRSEVNTRMARVAEWEPGVTLVDLYAQYPTLDIDVDAEQERLDDHDAVIFLFPMYWYSTPSILKEWQDLVLEYGYAYGPSGTALKGKPFLAAVSTGGPEKAYRAEGYNQFTIRQILAPLEATANLCGMRWLAPFVLHGARSAKEEGRVVRHLEAWEQLLEAMVRGKLDIDGATKVERLDTEVPRLTGEI